MGAEENKAIALELLQCFSERHIPAEYAKHVHPDFVSYHIGSTYPPGRDGWLEFMNKRLASIPADVDFGIDIRKVIAEGNHVWMWGVVKGIGKERESVDILLFEDGKIKAKWDVQQEGRHPDPVGL